MADEPRNIAQRLRTMPTRTGGAYLSIVDPIEAADEIERLWALLERAECACQFGPPICDWCAQRDAALSARTK